MLDLETEFVSNGFPSQCGDIREVRITKLENFQVATVEFSDRVRLNFWALANSPDPYTQDNIPAALTKDKKRIHGREIAVHLAWKSTLYVTNFPPSMDDSGVRALFAKVKPFPRYPLSVTYNN